MLTQDQYVSYPLQCPACKSPDWEIVKDDKAPEDGSVATSQVQERCCICAAEWTAQYQWEEGHGFRLVGFKLTKPGNKP